MSLADNLEKLKEEISDKVVLVAVSKTKPVSDVKELYDAGHRDFGENKVQELEEKHEALPKDIRWHLIGHLQRNKVKYIAGFVHLIHSVDSLRLLKEINKQGKKFDRTISCLLQIKIAEEDSKFGMEKEEAQEILMVAKEKFPNVRIKGLMGMATFTEDEKQIHKEFERLKNYFDYFKIHYPEMEILSMGMTSDYTIALMEGSTMLRVGSAIFGARDYSGN